MDANFRLKLKSRGIQDPELGSGLAYFVNNEKFVKHLQNHVGEDNVSARVILLILAKRTHMPIDRDLRHRIPRREPGEFEAVEGLQRLRGGGYSLPPWPCL